MGDYVYLKLQPHRQVSIRHGLQHKFSPKFYGPFRVESKVGKVAYKLTLPSTSAINPVFHVSQLKLCKGVPVSVGTLPHSMDSTATNRIPIDVLNHQLGQRNGRPVMKILVQWSNQSPAAATWEIYEDLLSRFPYNEEIFGDKNVKGDGVLHEKAKHLQGTGNGGT